MAVSPLVIPPSSAEKGTGAVRSKLASAQISNGATPEVVPAGNGTGYDLAEQMNEEEKHKYIKGCTTEYPRYGSPLTSHRKEAW